MININIIIDDEIHKQAKLNAINSGISLKDYIRIAISEKNKRTNKR